MPDGREVVVLPDGEYVYPHTPIKNLWNMGGKGRKGRPPIGKPKDANPKDTSAKDQNPAKKNTSD